MPSSPPGRPGRPQGEPVTNPRAARNRTSRVMGAPTASRVAVIGSGVSALTAAWILAAGAGREVTLYEAAPRLGGHADAHQDWTGAAGGTLLGIDTGFIVPSHPHLPAAHPDFRRARRSRAGASEMSMSVRSPWAAAWSTPGSARLRGRPDGRGPDPARPPGPLGAAAALSRLPCPLGRCGPASGGPFLLSEVRF